MTDAPWHIPELKYVVSTNHIKEYGTKYRGMVPDEVVKILSVRGPALDSHMDESKELGTSTLPEVAKAFSDDAVEMAGTHVSGVEREHVRPTLTLPVLPQRL